MGISRGTLELSSLDNRKAFLMMKRLGTGLNEIEVNSVRRYFRSQRREPTELELHTIGQTWSEHCFHKVFKSPIALNRSKIEGLFKDFIKAATEAIQANWIVSAFSDNAGIIKFEETYSIAAKVETHNHPSAIDPFGGAATGVGGVIRDILGVWGEPIANTDVLCFGQLDFPYSKLPRGIKHPRYLMNGVVAGIGAYGNNMGIPTVNGSIYFDNSFAGYSLVFCGCIGLVKNRNYSRNAKVGDVVVIAGSRTGLEGIHGVNFASSEIEGDTDKLRSAVQIPDPIVEEKLRRAILEIGDRHLASAITDLGGGGLSSAVCELAKSFNLGADIDIASVPVKSQDYSPWEIWISETQERMVVVVPEQTLAKVLSVFEREEIEASAIGKLVAGNEIVVRDRVGELARLDLGFLFSPPLPELKLLDQPSDLGTTSKFSRAKKKISQENVDLQQDLVTLLAQPNISSKERIVRTYDHEVGGATVVKPYQYPNCGPNDASVLKPIANSQKGVTISCGLNPGLGLIDTYWMAAAAIDEAIRNNVAVGGRRIALLDNFAWGSPDRKGNLSRLVNAAKACYDCAVGLGTPFISGKDSLYNETPLGDIAPTLLITAIGIIPDIAKCLTADFKRAGNSIYIIGNTATELGGSEYYRLKNAQGGSVPQLDTELAANIYKTMNKLTDQDFLFSCHDISQGGFAVALSEMCFSRGLGADVVLPNTHSIDDPTSEIIDSLFSESNSRFLVEVSGSEEDKFERIAKGIPFEKLGKVSERTIKIRDRSGSKLISVPTELAYRSWTGAI